MTRLIRTTVLAATAVTVLMLGRRDGRAIAGQRIGAPRGQSADVSKLPGA